MSLASNRKEKLPECILSRRSLSIKPETAELYGKYIKILPLDTNRDSESLFMISNGSLIQRSNKIIEEYDNNELIWKYLSHGPFSNINEFIKYLEKKEGKSSSRSFCVFDAFENYQIGIAGYREISSEHLKLDLSIWLSPIAQGTKTATEMCFLLFDQAFKIGYRRVQWGLLVQNIRSYKLATRVGLEPEFVQQKCGIWKDRGWNAMWLRILDAEWPEKKKKLEELLYSNQLEYN